MSTYVNLSIILLKFEPKAVPPERFPPSRKGEKKEGAGAGFDIRHTHVILDFLVIIGRAVVVHDQWHDRLHDHGKPAGWPQIDGALDLLSDAEYGVLVNLRDPALLHVEEHAAGRGHAAEQVRAGVHEDLPERNWNVIGALRTN